MLAIPNQSMHVRIGDPEVQTLLVGTSEALRVQADGVLPGGFSSHSRDVTSAGADLTAGEQRQQMGQSSGVRGLRRRRNGVRLLPACEWES
jgi:hypothetical protein